MHRYSKIDLLTSFLSLRFRRVQSQIFFLKKTGDKIPLFQTSIQMLAFKLRVDNTPTFTTPSFDFESHSRELLSSVNQVFSFRDHFWSRAHEIDQKPSAGIDLDEYKNDHLRTAVDNVLVRFNLLTTITPLKKRAASNLRAKGPVASNSVNNNIAAVERTGIYMFL
jgi:hypothetical protein